MAKYNEFGQMGSIFSLGGADVIPPHGMCIVAVQFLADNILTDLVAIPPSGHKYEYIGDAVVAHNGAVTTQTTAGGASTAGSPFLTLSGANTSIKAGMAITSSSIDGTHEDPVTVLKYDGATALTLSRGVPSVANGETLTFHDFLGSGIGGETTNAAVFPKGLTIYGRWEKVRASADANGGIICYLGALNDRR